MSTTSTENPTTEGAACCSTERLSTCCAPEAKDTCCGTAAETTQTTPEPVAAPSSCGCE